jgi:phosphomannomutase
LDALDDLARRHGVHTTSLVSRNVADAEDADALMSRLRQEPPSELAGFDVTLTDLREDSGPLRSDAVVLTGGDGETTMRMVVRPSGTEPKVKCYIEVRCGDASDVADARARAHRVQVELSNFAASL